MTTRRLLIALPILVILVILAGQLTTAFIVNVWLGIAVTVVMASLLGLSARLVVNAVAQRRARRI